MIRQQEMDDAIATHLDDEVEEGSMDKVDLTLPGLPPVDEGDEVPTARDSPTMAAISTFTRSHSKLGTIIDETMANYAKKIQQGDRTHRYGLFHKVIIITCT